jgi:hypothetical protein
MMNAMSPLKLPEKTKATPIEMVKFRDGMIVTAEDLEAAMRYPVSIFQTLVRSYFGCGVVCGLDLKPDPKAGDRDPKTNAFPTFVVCVGRGVALDCLGFPLELCGPVKIDLTPDPCRCEPPPEEVCIAIRRITSDEAPRDACACDADDPRFQCSRVRDHVLIKVFLPDELDDLAGCLCAKPRTGDGADKCCAPEDEEEPNTPGGAVEGLCDCLRTCSDCDCCEDSWVLLGCVTLSEDGIVRVDQSRRKYVKPIECVCVVSPELLAMQGKMERMEEQIRQMNRQYDVQAGNAAQVAATKKEEYSKPAPKSAGKAAERSRKPRNS